MYKVADRPKHDHDSLSLFRYFEVGLRVCDIVVKKFTFAISSPDEFLYNLSHAISYSNGTHKNQLKLEEANT